MASSKRSGTKNNDMLHIIAIVFLLIIIGVIIYMIYKTLKGKSEFFEIMNTIEHYTFQLNENPDTKYYLEQETKFQGDLKTNKTAFESVYNTANAAYTDYDTKYKTLQVDSTIVKSLNDINAKIALANSKITADPITSQAITEANSILNTITTSGELSKLQTDAQAKLTIATDLNGKGSNIQTQFTDASTKSQAVITDLEQGKLIRTNFDAKFAPTIQKNIDSATAALGNIPDKAGKTQEESSLIDNSRARLTKSISDLTGVLKTASSSLDHDTAKYKAVQTDISGKKTTITANSAALTGYITGMTDILKKINDVIAATTVYATDLPKITAALTNMSTVVTNYTDLNNFNTAVLAVPQALA